MQYRKLQKNNKGPAQYRRHQPSGAGFVILFAVTLASILLAIALGVSNIAFKELKFGTNARSTNDAFFAADVGAECALYYDRTDQKKFPSSGSGPTTDISCATARPVFSGDSTRWFYNFTVVGLGDSSQGCAKVTVEKTSVPTTKIVSKGYNDGGNSCNTQGSNIVERRLEVSY